MDIRMTRSVTFLVLRSSVETSWTSVKSCEKVNVTLVEQIIYNLCMQIILCRINNVPFLLPVVQIGVLSDRPTNELAGKCAHSTEQKLKFVHNDHQGV